MRFLIVLLAFSTSPMWGQLNSINLDSCLRWASLNYPIYRQSDLYKAQMVTNVQGIREAWLPKLNLSIQGTYQSEVVQFNIPGFTTNFPHDSYLGSLAVEQLLFDGGISKRQRQLELLNSDIEV